MWVETPEETIAELVRRGWTETRRGKKSYLVAPNGMTLVGIVDPPSPPLKLYVVQARRSTRFKVGISADPRRRMRDLQIGSAVKLELVCCVGIEGEETETLAHDIMRQHHCHGEWFDLGRHAEIFRRDIARCNTVDDRAYSVRELRSKRTNWKFKKQNRCKTE